MRGKPYRPMPSSPVGIPSTLGAVSLMDFTHFEITQDMGPQMHPVQEENAMRHGTHLLVVAGLLLLFTEAHALNHHNAWPAGSAQDVLRAVHQDGAVTESVQWAPGNACACPAVRCPFMNESSPPCQVSCASRQSAVCRCATCQGAGGIASLVGFNSCHCVTHPPSGSTGRRRR